MNRLSLILLVALTAMTIGVLAFTSQQNIWTVLVPILSIVLGWLLKTISDAVSSSQQHQWDLEKIAQERTLNYYEAKLAEMSMFVADELVRLINTTWVLEGQTRRIEKSGSKFTKEFVTWSASARTFAQLLHDDDILSAYTYVYNEGLKWVKFLDQVDKGEYDGYDRVRIVGKVTRIVEDGQSMSAFENYGMSLVEPNVLEELFNQLANTEGVVAEFSEVQIKGPAVQILPLMIFV